MGTPFSKIGGNPIVLGLDGLKDEVKAGLNTPADIPNLAVGSAAALLGDTEAASWMERTTAADGAALIDAVYGNTLRWNQLITVKARTSTASNVNYTGNADGTVTISGTASGSDVFNLDSSNPVPVIQGHKYVIRGSNTEKHVLIIVPNLFAYGNPDVIHTATDTAYNQPASIYFSASFTGEYTCNPQLFDLTAMFGAGNEPATVAEFEALFPEPYYPYDPGSLLPVDVQGVKTVGFNQWDEEWELGGISNSNGEDITASNRIRSKNYIRVTPSTQYCFTLPWAYIYAYDSNKNFVAYGMSNGAAPLSFPSCIDDANTHPRTWTIPSGVNYIRFVITTYYGTTYKHDICINLSDQSRNGTYEPYWSSQRAIPASTYFPDGMRSAGSVRDELRADAAVTRVGVVDLGGLEWNYSADWGGYPAFWSPSLRALVGPNGSSSAIPQIKCAGLEVVSRDSLYASSDNGITLYGSVQPDLSARYSGASTAADFKTAMSGVYLFYALATTTTTPIDPPLPLSYRTGAGGTERVMVASGTQSAPPIFATRYPLDPADLAASIAPVDGPIAKTNHQVGDLLMLGFTLCKATQVIVTGETIEIGTNVTRTTVAAELAALSE